MTNLKAFSVTLKKTATHMAPNPNQHMPASFRSNLPKTASGSIRRSCHEGRLYHRRIYIRTFTHIMNGPHRDGSIWKCSSGETISHIRLCTTEALPRQGERWSQYLTRNVKLGWNWLNWEWIAERGEARQLCARFTVSYVNAFFYFVKRGGKSHSGLFKR